MGFRCIHCSFRIEALFVQYSPGNIRLMKCENCEAVADEYIECETMILLIDLILQKRKAYRHLLYNAVTLDPVTFEVPPPSGVGIVCGCPSSLVVNFMKGILWKSGFLYLLLDAYKIFLLKEDGCMSLSTLASVWTCGKMLMDVILVNIMFLGVLLIATRVLLVRSSEVARYEDLLMAIIVSSYVKIFLIAMMVWEFPSTVLYIIDILVLSSNVVALKVVTESTMTRCSLVCFAAHAMKFLGN